MIMARSHFQELLTDRVLKQAANLRADISAGACQDYATYREACGVVRGLMDALALAEETEKEME